MKFCRRWRHAAVPACRLHAQHDRFGQSEVEQLGPGRGQHHVPWLQISVHNASAVRFFERVANLDAAFQRLLQRQRPFLQTRV
jgi:hypothetical protein